jgi:hypothetical protein
MKPDCQEKRLLVFRYDFSNRFPDSFSGDGSLSRMVFNCPGRGLARRPSTNLAAHFRRSLQGTTSHLSINIIAFRPIYDNHRRIFSLMSLLSYSIISAAVRAASSPRRRFSMWRVMSIPAEIPAEVIIPPSST